MKTVQQIRLSNFRLLLTEAGSQAELARRSELKQPYINQLAKGARHADGKPRSIGDEAARKLETGMDKPVGWMDRDHSMAMLFSELNGLEGQLITIYRQLDDHGRDELLTLANNLLSKLHPQPSAANPFAKAKTRSTVKEES